MWKHEGSMAKAKYDIDDIAKGVATPPRPKQGAILKCWELVARRQFTGLKDRKGVEIYEGDIIHNSNFTDDCNHVVDMFEDLGCWFMTDIKEGYAEQLSEWLDSSVVIGNVHQNPELLES